MTASCGPRRPRVAANPHQCSAYGMVVGQCLHDVSRISRSPGFFSSLLVGMDIIGMGDFAVSNFKGETAFTFRLPSIERMDFVPKDRSPKVGRNDPCPCGSGRKYKKCHLGM